MKEISKEVNLLYIIHGDSIMMRIGTHQGYEIIDVFSFSNSDNVESGINNKLINLFGRTFPFAYYGNIESTINKEGVIVHIHIKTYKVYPDGKYNVLDNYTDDIVSSVNQIIWLNKSEIKNEQRLREGDKKILERVFEDQNIDIRIVENQGDVWLDAKTILYEDR